MKLSSNALATCSCLLLALFLSFCLFLFASHDLLVNVISLKKAAAGCRNVWRKFDYELQSSCTGICQFSSVALSLSAEANAVTKQKDLSRFYKHILHQQTSGTEKKSVPSSPPATREENRRRGEDTHRREERSREAGERETEEEDSGRNRAERSPEAEAERKRDSVSPERLESPDKEPDSDGKDPAPASGSPAEQQETKPVDPAERRKAASAKRTGDQALQSARERYLTRKRARLSSGD